MPGAALEGMGCKNKILRVFCEPASHYPFVQQQLPLDVIMDTGWGAFAIRMVGIPCTQP